MNSKIQLDSLDYSSETLYCHRSGDILLSICIPTFNRSVCLARNLELLTLQLTPEVEVIIADNHSDDDTKKIILNFASKYNHLNLTFISHSHNIGFDLNLLSAVKYSVGEFCWFLGDDDLIAKDGVQEIANLLKTHKETVFILSNYCYCDQKDNKKTSLISISEDLQFNNLLDFFFYPCQNSYLNFLGLNLLFMSVCIVKKNLYLESIKDSEPYIGSHFFHFMNTLKMLEKPSRSIRFICSPIVLGNKSDRQYDWGGRLFWFKFIDETCEFFISCGVDKYRIKKLKFSAVNGLTIPQKIYHGIDKVPWCRRIKRLILELFYHIKP